MLLLSAVKAALKDFIQWFQSWYFTICVAPARSLHIWWRFSLRCYYPCISRTFSSSFRLTGRLWKKGSDDFPSSTHVADWQVLLTCRQANGSFDHNSQCVGRSALDSESPICCCRLQVPRRSIRNCKIEEFPAHLFNLTITWGSLMQTICVLILNEVWVVNGRVFWIIYTILKLSKLHHTYTISALDYLLRSDLGKFVCEHDPDVRTPTPTLTTVVQINSPLLSSTLILL